MLLLVVVAHPDDESFGCGSVLAHAAAAGDETAVLCATRGEAGESRIVTDDLAALREAELRDAARILGVGTVRLLDYADSGMTGRPVPEHARRRRADDGGGRGAVRRSTSCSPTSSSRSTPATGTATTPRSATPRSPQSTPPATTGRHVPVVPGALVDATVGRAHARPVRRCVPPIGELGTPDEEITTILDVAAHLATRWEAIRAHASQASPYDDLPTDLQHEFLAVDRLRLVRGDDLLAP